MIKVEFRGSGARPDSGRDLADPGLARGSGLELISTLESSPCLGRGWGRGRVWYLRSGIGELSLGMISHGSHDGESWEVELGLGKGAVTCGPGIQGS